MNTPALADADLERLQLLLDALPPPLEPLDVSALDGFLCGVLLQPKPVPAAQWLPWITDVEARPAPAGPALDELQALARRRHAEIDHAIGRRDWFDPWIFAVDEDEDEPADDDADTSPTEASVLPWVAGFAAAMDAFPGLMALDDPALIEPLALLYLHFPPEDLEDADALLAVIETLQPPADLAEAVQDLVRALMLMADVTRPRTPAPGLRPTRRAAPPGWRRAWWSAPRQALSPAHDWLLHAPLRWATLQPRATRRHPCPGACPCLRPSPPRSPPLSHAAPC